MEGPRLWGGPPAEGPRPQCGGAWHWQPVQPAHLVVAESAALRVPPTLHRHIQLLTVYGAVWAPHTVGFYGCVLYV